jgi:hypothetical protein
MSWAELGPGRVSVLPPRVAAAVTTTGRSQLGLTSSPMTKRAGATQVPGCRTASGASSPLAAASRRPVAGSSNEAEVCALFRWGMPGLTPAADEMEADQCFDQIAGAFRQAQGHSWTMTFPLAWPCSRYAKASAIRSNGKTWSITGRS